jgi:hypothetical protein
MKIMLSAAPSQVLLFMRRQYAHAGAPAITRLYQYHGVIASAAPV